MSVEIVLTNGHHLTRDRVVHLMEDLAQVVADYGLKIELTETFSASASIKSVYFGNHFGRNITAMAEEE
jgi:hypothetical protein